MKKVVAPRIDKIAYWDTNAINVDQETEILLDKLFDYLKDNINSNQEDFCLDFYYETNKGEIKDFMSFEDSREYYDISSYEKYLKLWESEYSEDKYWYYFQLRKTVYNNQKYYLIAINNRIVLNVDPINAKGWKQNREDQVSVVFEVVKDLLDFAKKNNYKDYVNKNLDFELRNGILLLNDYWQIEPEEKEGYFNKIANINVEDFIKRITNQSFDKLKPIKDMTARKYYEICRLAYNAIGKGKAKLTAKELFYSIADGRDQGLQDIVEDSAEDFNKWYTENEKHFDHTFEVLPGRSFYRGDLYVIRKKEGFYLGLSGSDFWTSLDMIKIYEALANNDIPVFLYDADIIRNRLLGKSYLAIVSKGITTYGYQNILGHSLIDSIHLPEEKGEQYINKVIWEEIEEFPLKKI